MDSIVDKLKKLSYNKFQKFIDSHDPTEIKKLKNYLDEKYYLNTNLDFDFPDNYYDYIAEKFKEFHVGYIPDLPDRVDLPIFMGSLSKFKPSDDSKITAWSHKFPSEQYVIEEKLDGVSCLFYQSDKKIQLFTRGDGYVGTDITKILKFINFIPNVLDHDIIVRGELIIPRKKFETKYMNTFATARNMVSGAVASKNIVPSTLSDIDFVAYEYILPSDAQRKLNVVDSLDILNNHKFKVVNHILLEDVNAASLRKILNELKKSSEYIIDGITVQPNILFPHTEGANPKNIFAFKVQDESDARETEVVKVHWAVTKSSYIKPRVEIIPVNIDGVEIKYVTGFNAAYIEKNKIGPGAVVRIIRAGDVIPSIYEILASAPHGPQMPINIKFEWNSSGVDIIAVGEDSDVQIQKLIFFFKTIGAKHIGISTITKLFEGGYNKIEKILDMSVKDFESLDGFGTQNAKRIYESIHAAMEKSSVQKILAAVNAFGIGIGEKRIEELLKIPNFFDEKDVYSKILNLPGFSEKLAVQVTNNIGHAKLYYTRLINVGQILTRADELYTNVEQHTEEENHPIVGKLVAFSGFRDHDLSDKIKDLGGQYMDSLTKKTNILVVKDTSEITEKIKKARLYCVEIITLDDFIKWIHDGNHQL